MPVTKSHNAKHLVAGVTALAVASAMAVATAAAASATPPSPSQWRTCTLSYPPALPAPSICV